MKFVVNSGLLLKTCQTVGGVLQSNVTLPIVENFLFEIDKTELVISGSDLETTMVIRIPAESKKTGKVAIPAKILLEALKTFADQPLTFSVDEKSFAVEVLSDYGKYKIAGYDGEEFPKLPEMDNSKTIEIPYQVLSKGILKTFFATGNDDMRPAMNGVFVDLGAEGITFVATDAHKLVKYFRTDVKPGIKGSFILPKKPLNLIKNMAGDDGKVKLAFNDQNASFELGATRLVCRLIEGKYPNYEGVIPKENPCKLQLETSAFLNSIRRVGIFSNQSTHQVRLKIAGSELQISAEDLDFSNAANERHNCNYEGQDLEIGFNARFLLELIQNLDSENVVLEMSAPNRAGLILSPTNERVAGEELLMLAMPVMLN